MVLYLLCPIFAQSNALVRQQSAYNVDNVKTYWYFGGKVEVILEMFNFVVNFVVVLWWKGSVAYKHFVDDDPKCPPIDQLGISLPLQHFRSDVVRRPHCAKGQFSVIMRPRAVLLQIFLEIFNIGVNNLPRHIIVDGLIRKPVFNGFRLLAQPEITQLYMTFLINKHVIRFEVTVYVVFLVDALNRQNLNQGKITI